MNSNLINLLMDIKRFGKQKLQFNDFDSKLLNQWKGNRQGGVLEPLEFI